MIELALADYNYSFRLSVDASSTRHTSKNLVDSIHCGYDRIINIVVVFDINDPTTNTTRFIPGYDLLAINSRFIFLTRGRIFPNNTHFAHLLMLC